eukprot:jgi/Tetstr1/464122/TSEL_008927.t1
MESQYTVYEYWNSGECIPPYTPAGNWAYASRDKPQPLQKVRWKGVVQKCMTQEEAEGLRGACVVIFLFSGDCEPEEAVMHAFYNKRRDKVFIATMDSNPRSKCDNGKLGKLHHHYKQVVNNENLHRFLLYAHKRKTVVFAIHPQGAHGTHVEDVYSNCIDMGATVVEGWRRSDDTMQLLLYRVEKSSSGAAGGGGRPRGRAGAPRQFRIPRGAKKLTVAALRKLAFTIRKVGPAYMTHTRPLEAFVLDDEGRGRRYTLLFSGSAVRDTGQGQLAYETDFVASRKRQEKGELLFLVALGKERGSQAWEELAVQVCDGNVLSLSCMGGNTLYVAP